MKSQSFYDAVAADVRASTRLRVLSRLAQLRDLTDAERRERTKLLLGSAQTHTGPDLVTR